MSIKEVQRQLVSQEEKSVPPVSVGLFCCALILEIDAVNTDNESFYRLANLIEYCT